MIACMMKKLQLGRRQLRNVENASDGAYSVVPT